MNFCFNSNYSSLLSDNNCGHGHRDQMREQELAFRSFEDQRKILEALQKRKPQGLFPFGHGAGGCHGDGGEGCDETGGQTDCRDG